MARSSFKASRRRKILYHSLAAGRLPP